MALHHNDSSASKKFDHQNSQIRCGWGKWIKLKVLFSVRKFIWDSLKTIEQKFFTKASENINIQHHGNNITSHYTYLVCVTTIQKVKNSYLNNMVSKLYSNSIIQKLSSPVVSPVHRLMLHTAFCLPKTK